MKPDPSAISALLEGTHADPFSLLGTHAGPEGTFARAIVPGAQEVAAFSLKGAALGKLLKFVADAWFHFWKNAKESAGV